MVQILSAQAFSPNQRNFFAVLKFKLGPFVLRLSYLYSNEALRTDSWEVTFPRILPYHFQIGSLFPVWLFYFVAPFSLIFFVPVHFFFPL